MNEEQERRLSAALRAQASGFPAAPAVAPAPDRTGLPVWEVLVLAVLLGAMAGSVAAMIST